MTNRSGWLTSAECADRTGVTIRALRVYERYGLLSAKRSPNGWRRYGPEELARLNTITVLKAAGLTLSQIREAIHRGRPSLEQILRAQMNAWKERRDMAERGYATAEAAMRRAATNETLPIDDLCALIRNLQMSDHDVIIRELAADRATPTEREIWKSWWDHHPEEALRLRAFLEDQSKILTALQGYRVAGLPLDSHEVQTAALKRMQLISAHKVLEALLDQLSWNRALTEKMYGMEPELMQRMSAASLDSRKEVFTPSVELWNFFVAAVEISAWKIEMKAILHELESVLRKDASPPSDSPEQLAEGWLRCSKSTALVIRKCGVRSIQRRERLVHTFHMCPLTSRSHGTS